MLDKQHRDKLVERIARIRREVELSQMDFENARRRLETDKERLQAATTKLNEWDADFTQTVVESTERLSLDPEVESPALKGKGKERECTKYR